MEQQPGNTYSHTADYVFIDAALKARWTPFSKLAEEFNNFVPKDVTDLAEYRQQELARLQELNPTSSQESLLKNIDCQIRFNAKPEIQILLKFSDRIMAEYVTVAFLAHALAESAINAILAIGLASAGAEDVFALLERADIKEKWLSGPKAFHPAYSLPKSGSLYGTLQHLTRQRNALVHYKIELEMGGEKKLKGSRLDRAPLGTQIEWIRRFFSLPYDLASHAQSQLPHVAPLMLYDSNPIQRFAHHTVT
ncbi:MAG: hypothetical protein SFY92_03845 [Verrucomicrobiae bacterium]|nr:hypothetical protein [Verrucomicrobiae bacterium]